MTLPARDPLRTILAVVVSIGWLGVVLIPATTRFQIDPQIQVGVQAAMMLILGAIFGVSIIKRSDRTNGND